MNAWLFLLAWFLLLPSALAQGGTFVFNNDASTLVSNGVTRLPQPDFGVELFYSPIPGATRDQLLASGVVAHGTPAVPGLFIGGTQSIMALPGSTVAVQVRGWSGSYGSYTEALAAGISGSPVLLGESHVFSLGPLGGGGLPIIVPTIIGPGRFQGLMLLPVPEPATWAVVIAGAALTLLARARRK